MSENNNLEYTNLKDSIDDLRESIVYWKEAALIERDERSRNIQNLEKFYALRSSVMEALAYLDILTNSSPYLGALPGCTPDNQILICTRDTLRKALQDAMGGKGL